MNVFNVVHYVSYANDEVVSVHRTIQGASIAAYAYAIGMYRSCEGYAADPDTQWDDGYPFWKWSDHLVKVTMEVLQP